MSDLRSQLIAKLGVQAPQTEAPQDDKPADDPLDAQAHLGSEWMAQLLVDARAAGIDVNRTASLGAARQAHDVLVKRLKANGRKREKAVLDDLRSRYFKKREKIAWNRLKTQVDEHGLSAKFYRSLKQSSVEPEVLLQRLSRAHNKNLNQAELRAALLGK